MEKENRPNDPITQRPLKNLGDRVGLEAEKVGEKHPPLVTIGKNPKEIFKFLREFSNHAQFMKGVLGVKKISPTVYHWVAESAIGTEAEWDTEVLAEKQDEMLAWQTLGDGSLKQTGVVNLTPASNGKGTVVSLKLTYENPVGKVAGILEKLVGKDPETQGAINLRRLKALLETGEIPTIEGQPSGKDEKITH